MPIEYAELLAFDRTAVEHSINLIAPVTPADLSRPTPCTGWNLADLIAHMTAQHRGFAAAAIGHGADPAPWRTLPATDPIEEYRQAARDVLVAFTTAAETPFTMPEIAPHTIPAPMAVGFHLVDYLVHSWDVAQARGVTFSPEPDLVAAALPIALAVPDDQQRLSPEFPFRPAVPLPDDAGPFHRLLAALGRTPMP
ncbi:TIGR03086 family metal-binding protein [Actinoplanes sp. NPDC023801]|uniref:TIGR03086 family metal-binding protein n=1 Tax=Actinoplanes sp. NPDC023801 TaxID=3154595 RepID=UPI0033C1D99F